LMKKIKIHSLNFLKLTECEMHVFRILEKQIELRNKIRFVDFKKRKKNKELISI